MLEYNNYSAVDMDWWVSRWPNFPEINRIACSHCGKLRIDEMFMDNIQKLRITVNAPLPVNSFYRCPEHPDEINKPLPGSHTYGKAVDLGISHKIVAKLQDLRLLTDFGITGVGYKQYGHVRFVHLDCMTALLPKRPRPHVWSYR